LPTTTFEESSSVKVVSTERMCDDEDDCGEESGEESGGSGSGSIPIELTTVTTVITELTTVTEDLMELPQQIDTTLIENPTITFEGDCAETKDCHYPLHCVHGFCECPHGYDGPDCTEYILCPTMTVDSQCSGHGTCVPPDSCEAWDESYVLDEGKRIQPCTGTCECFAGFIGIDCSESFSPMVPSETNKETSMCPLDCGEFGSCEMYDDNMYKCMCDEGHLGKLCEIVAESFNISEALMDVTTDNTTLDMDWTSTVQPNGDENEFEYTYVTTMVPEPVDNVTEAAPITKTYTVDYNVTLTTADKDQVANDVLGELSRILFETKQMDGFFQRLNADQIGFDPVSLAKNHKNPRFWHINLKLRLFSNITDGDDEGVDTKQIRRIMQMLSIFTKDGDYGIIIGQDLNFYRITAMDVTTPQVADVSTPISRDEFTQTTVQPDEILMHSTDADVTASTVTAELQSTVGENDVIIDAGSIRTETQTTTAATSAAAATTTPTTVAPTTDAPSTSTKIAPTTADLTTAAPATATPTIEPFPTVEMSGFDTMLDNITDGSFLIYDTDNISTVDETTQPYLLHGNVSLPTILPSKASSTHPPPAEFIETTVTTVTDGTDSPGSGFSPESVDIVPIRDVSDDEDIINSTYMFETNMCVNGTCALHPVHPDVKIR